MQNPISRHLAIPDPSRLRLSSVGRRLLDKSKDAGKTIRSRGGEALQAIKEKTPDSVEHAIQDTVQLGSRYQKFSWGQSKNFAQGVYQWGKDGVDTVVNVAKDPVGTAKAVGDLATNPLLNPVAGLARGVVEGKSVGQTYRDGAGQLADIGKGIGQGYADVYKEHGVAGVAGYVAPDIALAVLTGGSSATATGAGAATKGTAKAVIKESAGSIAKDAPKEVAEAARRRTVKDVGKEFLPGPEDSVDILNEAKDEDVRPFGVLGRLFDSIA